MKTVFQKAQEALLLAHQTASKLNGLSKELEVLEMYVETHDALRKLREIEEELRFASKDLSAGMIKLLGDVS